jgi:hypothetical protein
MGLNLEEGGGGDAVQYRGGRSALLGKKGGAPLPMPLGKKRGAPRGRTSGCHCRWGRRGECHGLLARAPPRLPLHCRCWRRREERCCRWGRRGECSNCLTADRSPKWCLSSILVPEQRRAAKLEEWRERFWIEWTRTGGRAKIFLAGVARAPKYFW